jgi:hypothetical protein
MLHKFNDLHETIINITNIKTCYKEHINGFSAIVIYGDGTESELLYNPGTNRDDDYKILTKLIFNTGEKI